MRLTADAPERKNSFLPPVESKDQHRNETMSYVSRSMRALRARRRWAFPLLLWATASCPAWGETVTFAQLEGAVIEIRVMREQRIRREGHEFSHEFQSAWKLEIGPGDRILSSFSPTAFTPKGTRTGRTKTGFFTLGHPQQVPTSGGGYAVWVFDDGKLTFLRTFHGGGLKMVVSFERGTAGLACSAREAFVREEGVSGIVLESAIDDGVPVTVLSAKQISQRCQFAKQPSIAQGPSQQREAQ